jgi:hypothetical protein
MVFIGNKLLRLLPHKGKKKKYILVMFFYYFAKKINNAEKINK